MLNQNTLSRSAGKGSPVNTKRTAWLLLALSLATGGVRLNGVMASSGAEAALPSSSHICTKAGRSLETFTTLNDTSRLASG